MSDTKKCSKCGEVKGLGEFRADKRATDGLQSQCAECQRAASRAYARKRKELYPELVREEKREQIRAARAKHPERFNQRSKDWRARNPDKVIAAAKRYRDANPEKVKAARVAWGEKNQERLREYKRKAYVSDQQKAINSVRDWQNGNRSKVAAYKKTWKDRNPDAVRAQEQAARDGLSDGYVKQTLVVIGVKRTDATPELIALKREQLAIKRMARELKKAANQSTNPTGENE